MKSYFLGIFQANKGEISGLNGIRAIAYFMLIYAHFYGKYIPIGIEGDIQWIDNFFMNGSLCMDAFFVLSGFLIGGQLFAELGKHDTISLKRFFLKRVLRIFPPYYAFLLLSYFWAGQIAATSTPEVAAFMREHQAKAFWDFVYMTDYFPGIMVHGWSLSIEEKFYLTLPFFLLWLRYLRSYNARLLSLTAVYILPLLIRTGLYFYLTQDHSLDFETYKKYFYYPFHGRIDSIFLGVMFASFYVRYPDRVREFVNSAFSRALALVGALVLLSIMLTTNERNPGFFTSVLRFNIAAFCWFFIMLRCFSNSSLSNRFLSWKGFIPVARLSYCAYIIHLIPLGALTLLILGDDPITYAEIATWTIPVALMILVMAYFFYLVTEKPFLIIKEKLTGRKPAVSQVGTAA